MKHAVTVDFGSTFTKVAVIDLAEQKLLLSDKVPSTVGTDASVGLEACFELAKAAVGRENFDAAVNLASSSAAGGLRMSVSGLTGTLSGLAGKSAALGAGAKIISAYSGILTEEMIQEMEEGEAEILLLCGGYERGNTTMIWKNANLLAESKVNIPIIYAGNSALDRDIRRIMTANRKECFTAENIIPQMNVLNAEPVQAVIRNLFLNQITDMKGLHKVKSFFQNPLVPTPAAVLSARELLSRGTGRCHGFDPVMIADIGGATTDIYSFVENRGYCGAKVIGVPEPFEKRTVEGDLGMRETSGRVINEVGIRQAAEGLDIAEERLRQSIQQRMDDISYLPDCGLEREIDNKIAEMAIHAAARRHAGRVMSSYSKKNQKIQKGRNLTEITNIIGTGGILVHNQNPGRILKKAEKTKAGADQDVLLPEKTQLWLDSDYVLLSAGLLREVDEEAAMGIMMNSIRRIR